ncbi:hypothetical protein Tco_1137807 [Tanacetum coccineum]
MEIPSILCPSCNLSMESSSHLFFSCSLARQVWCQVLRWWELGIMEAIQADCDVKATNIILQGLPPEERECKLYDEFDKFAYKKGETLRDFYLRFLLLLIDMNIYNVKLEQFQVNTKFLNTLPPEWSKFVKDVKLVQDLHTTNIDELHAYLGQHKFHANEVRLTVPVFKQGDDPIDAIDHMMSFISAVVTSRYPTTNNQLRNSLNLSRTYTPGASESNSGKQRTVIYSCEQSVEIDRLKQTLSKYVKEKEYLMQTVTLLKNDFKKEESRNIDREIALEKKIKQLDNIKAQQLEPKLYDGNVIKNTSAIVIPDSEETLMLAEESRYSILDIITHA